ncbi:MAG: hypothetical protein ABR961_00320 [Thermoanaerobaculaceae bacterium]|jgi:hypothetical protein
MNSGAVKGWAGAAAAALSLGLGLWQALRPFPEAGRTPKLAGFLAPLATAPVPRGAAIALAKPASMSTEAALFALFEAAWQRPDLHWTIDAEDRRVAFVVATPGTRLPAGFAEVWHAGGLVLFERAGR